MPDRVGPFELLKSIGTGGMAEVWSAHHVQTGTLVAVKVLTRASDPGQCATFRREVRAVAGLDHPHIARIYDQGTTEVGEAFEAGTPWLAMELARHGSLRERRGKLKWEHLRETLLQVLGALSHAHARGVIHRDIKPDNVLIGDRGALLADFGLAHELGRDGDAAITAAGSPAYMAPEQYRRSDVEMGPWTDLYGVGCLAWALVTGKPPFTGMETLDAFRNAHLYQDPPELEPRMPLPIGFEAWMRVLLAKSAGQRPRTAADAAWALAALPGVDVEAPTGDIPRWLLTSSGDSDTWHDLPLEAEPPPAVDGHPGPPVAPPPFPATWREPPAPPLPPLPGVGLGLLGTREVPVVGREPLRDLLWAELGRVHDERRPRVAILRGPAGIGTGRIARWLCRRAMETGAATVLSTTHSPVAPPGASLSWAVANLLRTGPLPFDAAADRIARAPELSGLVDPVDRAALAGLLDRLHGGRAVSRAALDAALGGLLDALTAERPVLLWLARAEHGATSLRWLARMLERGHPAVFAVLTLRDDDLAARPPELSLVQSLAEMDGAVEVPVGPLPAQDRAALIQAILPLQPDLARRIEARTGGHPGFATELIRDLVHRGQLVADTDGYTVDGRVDLPRDLGEAWARRLDAVLAGLPPASGRALAVAALLWTDLVDDTWRAVCARCGPADPDATIEPLLELGLAFRAPDGRGWSFAPGLRDALVARPADDGPSLHRICAEVVRERDGGAETEAHHLLAAGDTEAALRPLLVAAEERIGLGHYDEALALLDRRRDLGLDPSDPRSGTGEILRSAVHRYRGDADASEAALRALDPWLDTAGWEEQAAHAAVAEGALAYQRGNTWQAVERLRDAEERFLALDPASHGLPGCRVHLADCLMRLGRLDEARDVLEAALAGYRALGQSSGAANAMLALGGVSLRSGALDEAARWLDRAATAYAEQGVRYGLAEAHNRMGELARQRGDFDLAETLYRRAAEGFDAIGSDSGLVPRLNLGLVLAQRDAWEQAIEVLEACGEDARAQQRDLGDVVRVMLLPCYAAVSRWDTFDAALRDARRSLVGSGLVHPDLAEQSARAAATCEAAGFPERARAAAAVAIDQWRRLGRDEEATALRTRFG